MTGLKDLDFLGTLGTAKTATTNPDPNTLSTINPYPTVFNGRFQVSSNWSTQTSTKCKALIAITGDEPLRIDCVPSIAGATYTVTMWVWNPVSLAWTKPDDNNSKNLTGNKYFFIANPGKNPIWIELSNISSGNVAMYYDDKVARAA